LTDKRLGKYLKKLIGRTDLEDALKRLERLANEEVRMATAQALKATHTVDDKVGRVEDKVLDVGSKVADVDDRVAGVGDSLARVDERVAGVDDSVARVDERVAGVDDRVARVGDRVAGVDDRVARVDERVASVDDYVKAIDDKVAVVIDGEQPSLISRQETIFNILICLDGKETRVVIQQVADDMDQVKSLSFSFCVDIRVRANASLQGINYDGTFTDGSLPRILPLTITSPAVPIASK
jgi:archaellum component FlaC